MLLAIGMIGTAETMNLGIRYSWPILVFINGESKMAVKMPYFLRHSYCARALWSDLGKLFIITFYFHVCRHLQHCSMFVDLGHPQCFM